MCRAGMSPWPQEWRACDAMPGLFIIIPIAVYLKGSAWNQLQQVNKKPISYLKRHAPQFSWSEFFAQLLQSFCLRCHSSRGHSLIKCKTRRWFCLLPNAYAWGGGPWVGLCLRTSPRLKFVSSCLHRHSECPCNCMYTFSFESSDPWLHISSWLRLLQFSHPPLPWIHSHQEASNILLAEGDPGSGTPAHQPNQGHLLLSTW